MRYLERRRQGPILLMAASLVVTPARLKQAPRPPGRCGPWTPASDNLEPCQTIVSNILP